MKILLAVKETAASELAVEEVAGRPWPEGTSVEVLTVVGDGQPANLLTAQWIEELTALLRDAGLHAQGNVAGGDPKEVIIGRAADLIVMGAHRASALADMFMTSVAAHALRQATCSVAVVRPRIFEDVAARRILLATDGSTYSEAAARAISKRPWPHGTEVRVLSVVEVVMPAIVALVEPPFVHVDEAKKFREEALTRAQDAVADAAGILAPTGLVVTESISVLLDGTKEVILKEAREWGADWIFVGSHGRRGAERLFAGSISESIAGQAECSVEVVRTRADVVEVVEERIDTSEDFEGVAA